MLYHALTRARDAVASGERDANRVRQILTEAVESEPLARINYAEVADADTLEPLGTIATGRRAVGLLAAHFGPTRLIDNSILTD